VIRSVQGRVWAFDVEWVPDPLAGHLVYGISEEITDPAEVMREMWRLGGATEDDPTPFLKTAICRVVSIAAVERRAGNGEATVNLLSLPRDPASEDEARESHVVGTFLDALGRHRPQLVGFNSIDSDLKVLVQRGVIHGLAAPGFAERPEKPWLGIDYFARGSEWNVDLKEIVGGWGKAVPSLHEMAVQCGIPGKMEIDGNDVAGLWLAGDLARIVRYNEFDALTTYLLWLRVAHFAGHFTTAQYGAEQALVRDLLERESKAEGREHLGVYLEEWKRLQRAIGTRDS
jgi:predicted PolB exonuclease-like 3'-5' exonuclease